MSKKRQKNILKSGQLSDCKFLVGDGENKKLFHSHQMILAIESPVFEKMFFGGFRDSNEFLIPLPDIDPNVFQMILEFIYCREVTNIKNVFNICSEILYATEKYMLFEFKKYWLDYMESCIHWEPRHILKIFQVQTIYEEELLIQASTERMISQADSILKDEYLYEIDAVTFKKTMNIIFIYSSDKEILFRAIDKYAGKNNLLEDDEQSNDKEVLLECFREHMLKIKNVNEFLIGPGSSPFLDEKEGFHIIKQLVKNP